MLNRKNVNAFSDSGSFLAVGTSWTYGLWQKASDFNTLVTLSYKLSETLPSKLQAQIQMSAYGGMTSQGPLHQINFISGGVIDVDDAVWDLPVGDTDKYMFEASI